VVDDDTYLRQVAQASLEAVNGWKVLTAGSGLVAIAIARERRPDVVLLDLMMPGMDGVTTFEHLQADEATRDIPVIMFTAKLHVRGEPAPWDGHAFAGMIPKPYDPLTLGDQVAEMLGWSASP
jgi:CheY-like chemotaxis protein